ncbi:MAG: DsbA family oxidoreductase [Gammaproteobacteria bacterium]
MPTLSVVSDVVCPWCYIGKHRLNQALANIALEAPDFDINIRWLPFELNPDLPAEGMSRSEYCIRKFGSMDYANRLYDNVAAHARADGLPVNLEKIKVTPNTTLAHRLIWFADQQGRCEAMIDALFTGYFVAGKNIGDADTLASLAAEIGFNGLTVKTFLASDEGVKEHWELSGLAVDSGAQGVPAYLWGDRWLFTGAQTPETIATIIKDQLFP